MVIAISVALYLALGVHMFCRFLERQGHKVGSFKQVIIADIKKGRHLEMVPDGVMSKAACLAMAISITLFPIIHLVAVISVIIEMLFD